MNTETNTEARGDAASLPMDGALATEIALRAQAAREKALQLRTMVDTLQDAVADPMLECARDLVAEAAFCDRVANAVRGAADAVAIATSLEQQRAHTAGQFATTGWAADRDLALWKASPVRCVPLWGVFDPLPADASSHRFLVARTGLWLECRRPWLHLIWPVAPLAEGMEDVSLPFGDLQPSVVLAFGKVPHAPLREFLRLARHAAPDEAGAWLQWSVNPFDGDGELEWCGPDVRLNQALLGNGDESLTVVTGAPDSLVYSPPASTEYSTPCIDVHSHGTAPAFFSTTDDADDRHSVKIAIVIGSVHETVPTIAARLCCLGVTIPITVDAAEVFGGER